MEPFFLTHFNSVDTIPTGFQMTSLCILDDRVVHLIILEAKSLTSHDSDVVLLRRPLISSFSRFWSYLTNKYDYTQVQPGLLLSLIAWLAIVFFRTSSSRPLDAQMHYRILKIYGILKLHSGNRYQKNYRSALVASLPVSMGSRLRSRTMSCVSCRSRSHRSGKGLWTTSKEYSVNKLSGSFKFKL